MARGGAAVKLTASGYKWDGRGDLHAIIVLLADDEETPLYQDSINLSKSASRHRLAHALLKRFPQLKGKDIEGQLLYLLWQAKSQQQEAEEAPAERLIRESQADKLVALVESHHLQLFHTPTRIAYARIPIVGHMESHRCRSQGFKQWLSHELYRTEGKIPNSDSLNSAIITIEAMAIFDGTEYELHNRVAFHDGAIWYDLADDAWRAVRITPNGWEIEDRPPILFARHQHQRAQVEPARGGDPWQIMDFINLKCEEDRLLFMVDVGTSFVPDIPHPIIHSYGDQGSAKTTKFKIIVSLVDPSMEELIMFPRDINELSQRLYHHWVCCFDNLSSLPEWVSDVLSRAVTGTGFGKRELFSDEGDVIFRIQRIIGLNGINVVATKPDLLDRCILLELEPIPPDQRKEERQLLAAFEQAKPQILGGFLDIVAAAMSRYPNLRLEALPRMADFARWGAAMAEALGYSADAFLRIYEANIGRQNVEVLTSNPVASAVLQFMEGRDKYEGTPSEFLDELTQVAEQLKIKTNVKSWPSAPQVLARRLNELRTNLRRAGIGVDTGGGMRVEGRWQRLIVVQKMGDEAALRAKILELGAKLSYPEIEFAPGKCIPLGEMGWRTFSEMAPPEHLERGTACANDRLEGEKDVEFSF
jgi:hypothetical protein